MHQKSTKPPAKSTLGKREDKLYAELPNTYAFYGEWKGHPVCRDFHEHVKQQRMLR